MAHNVGSFFQWFHSWYEGVLQDMTIMIGVPNDLMPLYKPDQYAVILHLFKKENPKIDEKKYLQEIISQAKHFKVNLYYV